MPHWTSDPKKMKAAILKRKKTARKNKRGLKPRGAIASDIKVERKGALNTSSNISDFHVAFASGYLLSWLESYADKNNIPRAALIYIIGKRLQDGAKRSY